MPVNSKAKFVEQKSAQEIQDDILIKMSAGKKLKLASDFSMFILKSRSYGFRSASRSNRKDS